MGATTKELYAELDNSVPGWREQYGSFSEALSVASDRARQLHKQWSRGLEEKTKVALQGKRRVKDEDVPVFDRGGCGRSVAAERTDEPGNEDTWLEDVEGWTELGHRPSLHRADRQKTPPTFNDDSLYHPERYEGKAWSMEPYHWNPVPPRSLGAVRCY